MHKEDEKPELCRGAREQNERGRGKSAKIGALIDVALVVHVGLSDCGVHRSNAWARLTVPEYVAGAGPDCRRPQLRVHAELHSRRQRCSHMLPDRVWTGGSVLTRNAQGANEG